MALSAKTNYYLKRILPIGLIWLFIGWAFLWSEYAVLGDGANTPESAIRITPRIIVFASISVFAVGCLVGFIEVRLINKLFAKKSFPQKLVGKFLLYAILMFCIMLVFFILAAAIELQESVFSKNVWDRYVLFFFSITHISTAVQLLFSLIVSLLYAEISENIGQHVLLNFFTGHYHKPRVEHRMFMFVDMKDSTSIAEKIGHKTYFKLLKDYYQSFSEAIIRNYGEVYQYVGDEIVITWKLERGLQNNNALQCFFEMKAALQKRQHRFTKEYGLLPDFKAALHIGQVTTGEIGALKKDIFFTGDVLNTTARILSLSTQLQQDFLISESLANQLQIPEPLSLTDLGTQSLKGKTKPIRIFAINNKELLT